MLIVPITTITVASQVVQLLVLSVTVIRTRRGVKVSLMHGDDPRLIARMRAHGNFTEYAAFFLALLLLNEVQATLPVWALAVCGGTFALGRVSHCYGLMVAEQRMPKQFAFRIAGMATTLTGIAVLAVALLLG